MDHNSLIEKGHGALPLVSWQCPVCQAPLEMHGRTWQCQQQHSFDCAKEGYVNLLLAQHKNSKAPGDNKDMVLARHAFLATQAYMPLAETLASMTHSYLQQTDLTETRGIPLLFDVGCSEGYYSALIQNHLKTLGRCLQVAGVDISKPATQRAAKSHAQNQYAVASSYNIPLPDQSVNVALQVFAPSSSAEVRRVLQADGIWLMVEPNANHLQELKGFVYAEAKSHEVKQDLPSGFRLDRQSKLCFCFNLDNETDRLNLLKMTPYYWRISLENKALLLKKLTTVTADFTIKQYCVDESESSLLD